MAVGPDGEVYAVGIDGTFFQNLNQFVIAKSTNAKNSAVSPTFAGQQVDMGGSMVFGGGPNPGGLLGQANVAVDRSNGSTRGNVYILASVNPPGADPLDVHLIRSMDGGVTWDPPVRVNNDPTNNGAWQWFGALSVAPNGRIDVIWNDTRNSGQDNISELFYAYSYDAGTTWLGNIPVSPPYNSFVGFPNQNKIGDYYTLISDETGADVAYAATFNGEQDVYYLRVFPAEPVPDIKGNGSDGPITISSSQNLRLTVQLDAGGSSDNADWWVLGDTPFGWYYYNLTLGWLPGIFVTFQGPLFDLSPFEVLDMTLPEGSYKFYFGVDMVVNGSVDLGQIYYDSVDVTVQ